MIGPHIYRLGDEGGDDGRIAATTQPAELDL